MRGGVNRDAVSPGVATGRVATGAGARAAEPGSTLRVAVDHAAVGTFAGRERTEATAVGTDVRVVMVGDGARVDGWTPGSVCVVKAGMLALCVLGGATGAVTACDEPRIGADGGRFDRLRRGSTRRTGAFTRGGAVLTIRGPEVTGPLGAWMEAEFSARGVEVASAGAWRPASR